MMTDLPAQDHVASPARKSRRWLALLLAAVVALAAGAGWLSASTSGLQLLAAAVSHVSQGRISFTGVSGTLLGPLGAKAVVIDNKELRIMVHDIRLDWRPAALLSSRLEVAALAAQDVEVLLHPSAPRNNLLPDSLRLPLPVSLGALDIKALRVASREKGAPDFTANNLTARLESDGRLHRLQDMRASLAYGKLTASGQVDGERPFAMQGQAELAGSGNLAALEVQEARISATVRGNLMRLTIQMEGAGAGLAGKGEAQLTPFAAFPLAALHLQASGLDPHAFSPEAPKANLTLGADLQGKAGGRLEGNVAAKNASPAAIDQGGLPLLEARARAALAADVWQFDNLELMLAGGGSISGRFAWQQERLMGSADLVINRLDPAALDSRLRSAQLHGNLKLSGNAAAQQGVLALSDGKLQLDAHLARSGDTLTLDSLRLARGQAMLTGQGKLTLGQRRPYTFEGKLQHFDLAAFLRAPHSNLNATLDVSGELEPQATGTVRFFMGGSRVAGLPVSGSGLIEFTGMRGNGEAELALGDNRMNAKGGFGDAKDHLQLDVVAPALGQLGHGFGGALDAHASLSGSLDRPQVTLEAKASNLVLPGDHYLGGVNAVASLHEEELAMKVNVANYRAREKRLLQSLLLEVHGSRSHHELVAEALLREEYKLRLRANGGLTNPATGWKEMQWQGALSELSGDGMLPFKLLAAAPLSLGRNHASLDAAELAVAGGRVRIDSATWAPRQWSSRGNFTGIGVRVVNELRPELIAMDVGEPLRFGGAWDIASAMQLTGSLHIARESGDWVLPGSPPLPLGLREVQFTARAADGQLAGNLTATGERLGEWHASIAVPLAQSGAGWTVPASAPLTGQMRIDMADLAWVGPAISANLKSGGRLVLEGEVAGSFGAPRLVGQIHGEYLALAFLDQGVRLQDGQLAAYFDQESLHLGILTLSAPHAPRPRDSLLMGLDMADEPGRLVASGVIGLTGESGDLKISASRLPLAQRDDRWIIASGSGQATLDKNVLVLSGNVIADAGLINEPVTDRPQLSDDIVIVGREEAVRKGPRISVDATLDMGEHFYLRASGLEARLAGQLSMHQTPGKPLRVTGTIAASDASFEAYGQLLTVERGLVNFQGPLYDPGLNILALRKGLSVEAGVEVTGTALHPVVRLVSTPVVPDPEKLSWIVLGRPPVETGADSSVLLAAAGSILGGRSSGIIGQLRQTLGVDELSLRQAETAGAPANQPADENPLSSQIVTIGKRLSERVFLSYEQGVTAAAGVTKLTYILTTRVSVVTQTGVDNAIDVFYTFNFD